jgi:hypothetical protein
MESRSYTIRITLLIAGVAMMLMVTTNATAQVCSRRGAFASTQRWAGAGLRSDASRSYIARDLQFRSTVPHSRTYVLSPGFYGYSHYGPVPGIYGNHYGYYARPYVYWAPHYGWVRHGFRRAH